MALMAQDLLFNILKKDLKEGRKIWKRKDRFLTWI